MIRDVVKHTYKCFTKKLNYKNETKIGTDSSVFECLFYIIKSKILKNIVYIYMDEKAFCVLTKFVMDHGKMIHEGESNYESKLNEREKEKEREESFFSFFT